MEHVEIYDFNFSAYPEHVMNLANFAFKIVAMNEFMDLQQKTTSEESLSILWLDSGLEVLSPFVHDVKRQLSLTGQISATQVIFFGLIKTIVSTIIAMKCKISHEVL